MKSILYYETVFDEKKKKILGTRPEYGIGSWWLIITITICEKLSHYFLTAKMYLEKYVKHEEGKLEKL